jgi:hypothetical protein
MAGNVFCFPDGKLEDALGLWVNQKPTTLAQAPNCFFVQYTLQMQLCDAGAEPEDSHTNSETTHA